MTNMARREEARLADPPGYRPTRGDTWEGAGRAPATSMPRWVKVFVIVAILLVLAFVVSFLAGVRHGPGLHTPSGDGGHTPTEQGP